MAILVVAEVDDGTATPGTLEALTVARGVADRIGADVHALVLAQGVAGALAAHGADVVHEARHDLLGDYGPDLWGETIAQAVAALDASAVVAVGSDRGNEAMANAAARMGLAMAANCIQVDPGVDPGSESGPWVVTRVRWGGSLLEQATLDGPVRLLTVAEHAVEIMERPAAGTPAVFEPRLDPELARTRVRDRVVVSHGATLATAPVVVGGGRGVGSADGFAVLDRLAGLLGGVVGCSRVVTNNGWRPHTDQVGQTGTRIAPQLYIACGISGAIQHWVGAMASKHILAVNTDRDANMVTRADYAVIGDLHEVLPAVIEEIERRR